MPTETDISRETIIVIAFFAMAFVVIGAFAPTLYYKHAPMDQFIEVHEFRAENTTTNATEHELRLSRTVHHGFRGDVIIELSLIGEETETQAMVLRERNYFEVGNKTVVFTRRLPANLAEGRYYYRMNINARLPEASRDLTVESNTFRIENATEANATDAEAERIRLTNSN